MKHRENTRGKLIFLAAVMVSLVALLAFVRTFAADPVTFEDDGLYEAVVDALDAPEGRGVTRLELSGIEELDASGYGIESLEGIEYLTHLVRLDLSDNRVESLEPLAELGRLRELSLRNNGITDLESVNFETITDIPLRVLSLRHNVRRFDDAPQERLSDISLLSEFQSLEELSLRDNHIENLVPLAQLTELRELDLRENHFDDIRPLQELSRLEELNIRENAVADLSPLRALTDVRYLNIHSNPDIADLTPVGELSDLETLIMRNVPVDDDLAFLSELDSLNRLNVRNTGITSLDEIGRLMEAGALQTDLSRGIQADVDIRDNPVPDPTPDEDPFASIRDYWQAVSRRDPRSLPEPRIPAPEFSRDGGLYTEPFELELSAGPADPAGPTDGDGANVDIYYTLDGSVPDPEGNSEATYAYDGAIRIESGEKTVGELSLINPRYGDRDWDGPRRDMFSGTTVRAVAISEDGTKSMAETHSYLVDPDIHSRFELPVVSLTTDADHFFDYDSGIYVPGQIFDETKDFWEDMNPDARGHYHPANFHQRSRHSVGVGGLEPARYGSDRVALDIPDHGFELEWFPLSRDFTEYMRNLPIITIEGTDHYDGRYTMKSGTNEDRIIIERSYVREQFPPDAEISVDWERPVHFELFESDGTRAHSQNLGVRINGNSSRTNQQKSLRFYARGTYSETGLDATRKLVDHQLFTHDERDEFKRFLLRRTTERSGLNDVIGQQFMKEVDPGIDIQEYRPVVAFLNGEFWGIYTIRDRYDHWYFGLKYDVDRRDIAIASEAENLRWGDEEVDGGDYDRLRSRIRDYDLSDDEAFDRVTEVLDVDRYATWVATGIFLNHRDWGSKHSQFWRYSGDGRQLPARDEGPLANDPDLPDSGSGDHPSLDGRWRPMSVDMDGAFGQKGDWTLPEDNYLEEVAETSTYFLGDLVDNSDYRGLFINRFADIMNSVFQPDRAVALVNDIAGQFPDALVEKNIDRWRHLGDLGDWHEHVDIMRDFLRERPDHARRHLVDYFDLDGQAELSVSVAGDANAENGDPYEATGGDVTGDADEMTGGSVQLNSLDLADEPDWRGTYFKDVPVLLQAEPADGYQFAGWDISGENRASDRLEDTEIELELEGDTQVTAVFEPVE